MNVNGLLLTLLTAAGGFGLMYVYISKLPPLATEPNYFLQDEKPPKNLWLSRKVILGQAARKNQLDLQF